VRQTDDDEIDYDEFIDVFARDTVAPAAMGKRDMQSKEAMGEDAYELLNEELGHKKIKNFKMEGYLGTDGESGAVPYP